MTAREQVVYLCDEKGDWEPCPFPTSCKRCHAALPSATLTAILDACEALLPTTLDAEPGPYVMIRKDELKALAVALGGSL